MSRSTTPTFVLELKLQTNTETEQYLHSCFYFGARIYNTLVRHCRKQITKLRQDKEHRQLLALYIETKNKKQKNLAKQVQALSKELTEMVRSYELSEYQLHAFVKPMQHAYKNYIGSMTAQKLASAVWSGVQKVLYSNGKELHFKKYADLTSLEGKNNQTNIYLKDGRLQVGRREIGIRFHKKDGSSAFLYERECLTHPVKYCRIVRRAVGTRYHYYVQLILDGTPPRKHKTGHGTVGLDIGVSTVAAVSDTACTLTLLGESVKEIEKEQRLVQRKMDRSRRSSNPQNYNDDGTIKKGKKKWVYSSRYDRLRMLHKDLCRRRSAALRQEQCILANRLAKEGHIIYAEHMNFKGLQKRGTNGKKRFGKAMQVRAPAQFLCILEQKLRRANGALIKINTRTFKASQYDHVTDTYKKKKLSKRYNTIEGKWIQRDLYSAFLIRNTDSTLEHTDRRKCLLDYPYFLIRHDACITALKQTAKKRPSCFGF